jgi:hypothetical protein
VCGTPKTLRKAKDDPFNNLGSFDLFEFDMRKNIAFQSLDIQKNSKLTCL